jgi:hemerythrin
MPDDGTFIATWKPAYAVGEPLIDAQHQSFFDEVNAVVRALDDGWGRDLVIEFYRRFYAALVIHFRDEEAVLSRLGYDGLVTHRREHEALLSTVASVEGLLLTGSDSDQLRLLVKTLFTALVDHLTGTDMRYKAFLRGANQG